jgi:N4-gp56 family major capsid protein
MAAPNPYKPAAYNDPAGGVQSSIGPQAIVSYHQRQALIEARREQYFTQLADVTSMPKNMGKEITKFHYIPLLDDQNLNDQGIDASGVTIKVTDFFATLPGVSFTLVDGAAATAAVTAINAIEPGVASAAGAVVTVTHTNLRAGSQAQTNAVITAVPGTVVKQGSGNIYGSSKDIGLIPGKLPVLTEFGGRVNRVGFTRKLLKGTLEKFGFYQEYTQESLDFDSDEDLQMHINREMLNGANQMTEAALQIDIINSAGVIRYAGDATSNATIDKDSVVTYDDLMRLAIALTNNRTPRLISMITGTRYVDTKTISGARALYCGSELLPTLKAMKDLHGTPAFTPLEKYAAGGSTMLGEVGAVDEFRVIVVPEMLKWAGKGALVEAGDASSHETGGRYDVFPMLVIGAESFTTIGFQSDGKTQKFKIYSKKPGEGTADRFDPYGEMGFMSIKWYYGFMVLRPERLGLIKTVARL